MKSFLTILLAWLSISAAAVADDEVIETLNHFLYGASINSAEIHDQFWAQELTYTSSGGTRFGKPQLMQGVRGGGERSEDEVQVWYKAEDIEVKSAGSVRIVNFVLTADTESDTPAQRFYNTGVFVYRDERWQAINWNATASAETQDL